MPCGAAQCESCRVSCRACCLCGGLEAPAALQPTPCARAARPLRAAAWKGRDVCMVCARRGVAAPCHGAHGPPGRASTATVHRSAVHVAGAPQVVPHLAQDVELVQQGVDVLLEVRQVAACGRAGPGQGRARLRTQGGCGCGSGSGRGGAEAAERRGQGSAGHVKAASAEDGALAAAASRVQQRQRAERARSRLRRPCIPAVGMILGSRVSQPPTANHLLTTPPVAFLIIFTATRWPLRLGLGLGSRARACVYGCARACACMGAWEARRREARQGADGCASGARRAAYTRARARQCNAMQGSRPGPCPCHQPPFALPQQDRGRPRRAGGGDGGRGGGLAGTAPTCTAPCTRQQT